MSRLALVLLLGEELAVPVAPRSSCGLLGGECADSIEDGGDDGGSDYSEGPFLIDDMYTSLGWMASQGHTAIKEAMQRPIAD
jgi:hypothetical protein